MTPLTGRTDIGEGSPPGPNHPGKSRGLVLPQQSLRTGTDKLWGHQDHGHLAGWLCPPHPAYPFPQEPHLFPQPAPSTDKAIATP